MVNVRQIWEETSKQLEKVYDRREAENIAYLLLEDQFDISRAEIMLNELKEIDIESMNESVRQLLDSQPIQYVTGVSHFYNRKFHIEPGALIPRPETEELIDLIIRENGLDTPKILDVGVGSGCIAISLALEIEGAVYGTDVSDKALKIAELNAERLNAKVSLIQHDILNESLSIDGLDILVSNPPYIPLSEKKEMHFNVLGYEPEIALFVPDQDSLIFYRRIAEEGISALNNGGKLYFEIHEQFGEEITSLLDQLGYAEVKIHQDMQGKDRMVSATNSTNK